MSIFAERRERLWQSVQAEAVRALLITNPINVSYLTGFSGESSYLLFTANHVLLISDGRFTEQLAEECPDVATYIRPTGQTLTEATSDRLQALGASSIGYESGHLTVADFETLRDAVKTADWKPARDRVEKLRMIKDASEIEQIRDAIRMAEKSFTMFRTMLRPDDCEKDLADTLEYYQRRAGGKTASFASIVAVGPRAALPHAPPTSQRLSANPVLLVDWGVSGPFYKSDLTRVLWSRNKSSSVRERAVLDKLREVYALVLEAQRRAIGAMKPNVKAGEVDAIVRAFFAEKGYGQFFNHGLGHGLGMQVHEAPFMRPNAEVELKAGMVITVEPGLYLPGEFGVRIEDDILITPNGAEILTSYPREFEACEIQF